MRLQRTPRTGILFLALAAVVLSAVPGECMPGFARKYRLSCTVCHAPFPRLKPFGEEFAGLGFRMPDPSQEPSRAIYDVGDPLLTLPREVPLGVRMDGFVSWKEDALAEADFEWPWVWKILSGGPIGRSASYYFYFLIERGEVEGLEDAYIQLNQLFGLPVDLLAGQFQVSDPMFKREARLERADYLIYKAQVGDSPLDLTYERGVVLSTTAPGEIGVVLQVVNGNGIRHPDEGRNFDGDKLKNPALHLSRSFEHFNLGFFGYYGKQEHETGIDNETYYFGPNLSVLLAQQVELNLQYLERRDDNPFFVADPGDKLETRGGFAELHWFPQGLDGRWIVSGLYNQVDSDDGDTEVQTLSLTVNHLLARNLRLLIEGEHDLDAERSRASLGLIAAF